MGKRKGAIAAMGASILVKDRSRRPSHRKDHDSFLHTTDINDGQDYNRINFQSVTEQSNLEDFLNTADMAGRDFTAERQNITVVTEAGAPRLTQEQLAHIHRAQASHQQLLRIPRRPEWDETTTKEQLILSERESFTDWRRNLKMLEETEHIQMTPYEKNLDFWRQLWRVIERSDVLVQIVDARNPLLFRCQDLDTYVKEVDPGKTCLLLVNKADYLSQAQRQAWVHYFNKEEVRVVFFSAKEEKEKMEEEPNLETLDEEDDSYYDKEGEFEDDDEEEGESFDDSDDEADEKETESVEKLKQNIAESLSEEFQNKTTTSSPVPEAPLSPIQATSPLSATDNCPPPPATDNCPDIVTADRLLEIFRSLAPPISDTKKVQTVGMVGYPNVGKSSTINVILDAKKLGVSATPGKTKHFQTLHVTPTLLLCDCPGLVFPSFVATKAHLVTNGILPIDELRDHVAPVTLVCECVPRGVLEATYSIMVPRPSRDDVEPDRPPTAEELLTAYGAMRGFMSVRGVPDCPRASRYILKDFVKGKLLYCNPPPGIKGEDFQDSERNQKIIASTILRKVPPPQVKSEVDVSFFAKKQVKANSRGKTGVVDFIRVDAMKQKKREQGLDGSELGSTAGSVAGSCASLSSIQGGGKPWKKHNNKNKKEKLRRLHRDLDVYT